MSVLVGGVSARVLLGEDLDLFSFTRRGRRGGFLSFLYTCFSLIFLGFGN